MAQRTMTTGETHPSHPGRTIRRSLGLAAALVLSGAGGAAAFPFLDATNEDQVPQGTELASPDALDLRQQLQLVNGLGAPAGGGWTFIPRIDWQEELTDNVLQAHSPRQADLVTYVTPGISIAGDLPRVRMTFDFAPTLALYARTSDLNALTEQMNGLASVTLVPDLAYVDVRALAGVQNQYGGLGGIGGIGAATSAAGALQGVNTTLGSNGQGLNRDNEIQTTSFAVSPYLLRRFGDWATAKVGYSLNVTQSDALSGFASLPFPSGGASAQTLVSNEELAHIVSGDVLEFFQNSIDVDLLENQITSGAGAINTETGIPARTAGHSTSTIDTVSDRITYQATHEVSVFASGGHEDITYSGLGAQSIHDLIWSLGTTWVPAPNSSLTVSYGHQNGFNSLTANGYYAVTARTMLTVTYGSTLGTQLQQIQNQLNLAGVGPNGTLVNAQTGGQLYGATNALGVQDGVFKTTTLTVGTQTTWDRDIFAINLLMTKETSSGTGNASTAQSKTASLSWIHQMRPDMTVSAAVSYAIQDQSTGFSSFANPGNNTSVAASLAWQWQISPTLSGSVRYSFFERQSPAVFYDIYQNLLIIGISKRF
jgi:hypothetical protein